MPVEKVFFWNAIPNIVLILLLLYYLFRRQGVDGVLVAMFVYLSLHGGYAIFAAATRDGINTLNDLHYQESDLGVKIVAAAFLLYCSVLLVVRRSSPGWGSFQINRQLFLNIGASLSLFLIAMIWGGQNLPEAELKPLLTIYKESLHATWMWVGLLFFAVFLKPRGEKWIAFRKEGVIFLAIVCVVNVVSGFYEIVTGVVWAGTKYEWGFSYRTSGAMFNPNVLGFWSALMIALVAFTFHVKWISRLATLCLMLFLVSILVLCSSRSGFVLSIMNLFIISGLLFSGRKSIHLSVVNRIWPLGCFVAIFALWVLFVVVFHPSERALVNTLAANVWRFLQLPIDIFWALMIKVGFPALEFLGFSSMPEFNEWVLSARASGDTYLSQKLGESVDGRTMFTIASDNSFASIYAIGGVAAIALWLWLWGILLWLAMVKNRFAPGLYSSYALVLLIFCFTSGIFLRTPQLFPTWIFISMVLGICMSWWLYVRRRK